MRLPAGILTKNYGSDMAILRTRTQWIMTAFLLCVLFSLPLFAGGKFLHITITIAIFVIAVHGLNILTGYCGQISLGYAAFMSVGAVTTAILCTKLELSFWAALPISALTAGLVGLLFGLPSLRIKGFYLALVTVAAQFIIPFIILELPEITGGADGLAVPRPTIGSMILSSRESYYFLILCMAILATLLAKNISRTRLGRAFIAIRDNDIAAETLGINLYRYKLLAFFLGCAFAGCAGSLSASYTRFFHLEYFTFMDSIWYLGMIIVGGMGSTVGVIFGVCFFQFLGELVSFSSRSLAGIFPGSLAITTSATTVMYGLIIVLFLIFEPRGLYHRWQVAQSYYRLWPFPR